jgi:uncharacterized protein YbjQ (UPF0145 family)
MSSRGILMLTSNYAPGYKVTKVLGMVYGIAVRSRGLDGNIMAELRAIKGGEINEYTEMVRQARQQALDRLAEQAASIAFGTGVVITPVTEPQQLVKLS